MGQIIILCGDFTEDYELAVPFHCLKMLGHEVKTTSPGKVDGQYITTCIHDFNDRYQAVTEWEGHRFMVDRALNGVDANDYDAIILPGGRACETLRNDPLVKSLVIAFAESQKVVATICRGLQILLATGLMKDLPVTGHPVCQAEASLAGAHWKKLSFDETLVNKNFVMGTEWPGLYAWLRDIRTALKSESPS
ncbi:putative cysteine protease YraA [Microbulbifer sp. NBRC 101763]|uniref:DJ-1/PfpI family protein n=1 Tax=Microbulbifer sp. NBRC 101763 TaxID=1113820 RepID=UPI0030A80D4F